MKAIIKVDVPEFQIGQEVTVYYRDTMCIKGVCEKEEERKTGKWFDNANVYDKRANKHDYFCLECKTHAMDFICGSEDWWCGKPPKYCPNCGAKMETEGE